ncbi:DNA -binding domain-containing protein [Variovorax sp. GB1P17]|uniref:DNA -binding domain-containing protein n=1 Tax=Variovorax sp. GB1P17 TaxID=3443740 RepID=UPI003F484E75
MDARDAHPVWLGVEDALPHLRPALAQSVPRGQVFSLWRIRGRKRLLHAGTDLILSVQNDLHGLHACISPALANGAACRVSLPLDGKPAACRTQMRRLLGELPQPCFRHVSRTAVLHMRGLQALDAQQGDCGQRGVAEALFGADTVAERWHADSDLRAQVRHILARAQRWVAGGYLQLAGVRPE